ncbi:scavenger receptor class B member 1-like [Trichoplusia ni]|uniref:Scavenger receptor class B member 1-like n=1 Tax=Trichoplusia ni TaxID=7111 RepID=A0A7E5VFR4_TRINI|nr:scavenger receptor class B member 1-like [Trichoplusia ni]
MLFFFLDSVIKLSYGILLMVIGVIMAAINPLEIATNWFLDMREGSFLYNMWENPTYELFSEMWVYNYTNSEEYLSGSDSILQVKEIGPFTYQEMRTNENLQIDKERGVMTMEPHMRLRFLPDMSVEDTNNVTVNIPNVALLAISTLFADKLGYFANAGAFYSMSALGSKLFKQMSVEQLFWGYHDPIVTIANSILPGWIDFKEIGLLDRFYAERNDTSEVELRNTSRRYSLNSWNNNVGLIEQGYTDWNTSTLCNRIKGSYEGLMMPANYEKGLNITVFRKQACRNYPFNFVGERTNDLGLNSYLYQMDPTAFSTKSPYACDCTYKSCPPEGFVDVSSCYYGFPIALSKPHFMDTDPVQQANFKGMKPDRKAHASHFELEPVVGAPLSFAIKIQINLAVRMSEGNPISKPLKDKVLPLMWFSMYCKQPPADVVSLLRLRLVIAPPLMIVLEIVLFLIGFILGAQGLHRVWKPKYKIVQPKDLPIPSIRRKSAERRRSSVILNMAENDAFKDDEDLAKEAVSLLAINEEDNEFVDLLLSSDNE